MAASDEIKTSGLSFGRSLHIVFKSAGVYPIEHPAVQQNLQQAFTKLEFLLKEGRPFTFGFVGGRALLNNLLTSDGSLASLEAEFTRRNVAAISFYPGLTFSDFENVLKLVAVSPKTIAQSGGLGAYLETRPVSHAKIISSPKKKKEDDKGDLMLDVDGESFLRSSGATGDAGSSGMVSIELLLKAAAIGGTGNTGSQDIIEIVQGVIEASAANPSVHPEQVLPSLASLVESVGPAPFLAIPGVSQKATSSEFASELWEVLSARWLASRLGSASSETELATAQEEASLVLARAKQATEMAERILRRVTELIQEQGLPSRLRVPIMEELAFSALPLWKQKSRLMALRQLSLRDLQRTMRTLKGLISEGKSADTAELVMHCCRVLINNRDQPGLLSWIPELIRASPVDLRKQLLQATSKLLSAALQQTASSSPGNHRSFSNCLAALAAHARQSDDFETLQQIASQLNDIIRDRPEAHRECCCHVLQNLLSSGAIDEIIELCITEREESDKSQKAIAFFRHFPAAMERVFERLEGESESASRLRLLKLAGQFRHSGIHLAIRRLQDENWFFVRNSCQLLGAMGDPDLVAHLAPLLRHSDERVQQAAFQTLQKSHLPGRIRAYAEALPSLAPAVLDPALDEIMFSLDPACIEGLRNLIKANRPDRAKVVTKALQIALIIDASACMDLTDYVLTAPEIPEHARVLARRAAEMREKK
ncbi:MAG: HEAT repeat domain-containing protein [Candidatus Korobacteraceae bacterium]